MLLLVSRTAILVLQAEAQLGGLPAFIEDAQLITASALKALAKRRLRAGFGNRLTVDKPPTPTMAAQCRQAQTQCLGAAHRTAQAVTVAHPDNRQRRRRNDVLRRALRINNWQTHTAPLTSRQPGLQWRWPQRQLLCGRAGAAGSRRAAQPALTQKRSCKPNPSGWSCASKVGGVVPSRVQAKRWRRQLGSLLSIGCPSGQQIAATPT